MRRPDTKSIALYKDRAIELLQAASVPVGDVAELPGLETPGAMYRWVGALTGAINRAYTRQRRERRPPDAAEYEALNRAIVGCWTTVATICSEAETAFVRPNHPRKAASHAARFDRAKDEAFGPEHDENAEPSKRSA